MLHLSEGTVTKNSDNDEKKGFAHRLNQVCDENPNVPPLYKGRLTWVQSELANRGSNYTLESVRRWFNGTVLPRQNTGRLLAEILQVEPNWLLVGGNSRINLKEQRKIALADSGVVGVLGGLLQISGYSVALPTDDDKQAEAEAINLYTILHGMKVSMCATQMTTSVTFPIEAVGVTKLIAVEIADDLTCRVFEVPTNKLIELGQLVSRQWVVTTDAIHGDLVPFGEFLSRFTR